MRIGWTQMMKRWGSLALFFVLSFASPNPVCAAEIYNNWLSTRALGMGNAYTALVDGADAIFYNPAALGFNTGVHFTLFDIHGGFNGMEAVDNVELIRSLPDDIPGTMKKLYGKRIWAGAGGKTAIVLPYFGVAGFFNTATGFTASNPPNPSAEPSLVFDYGAALGFAVPVVPGIANVGMTFKRINRTGTTDTISAGRLATMTPDELTSEFKRRGTGYGLDFGGMLKVPGPVSPSLSFVYRDFGFTSFVHEEGAGAPSRIEPEMVLGGALEISAPLLKITPAFDIRYLNRADYQFGKKLNLGLEVSLPLIDLRAGLHQGYYSAGVGLNLALLHVDVATWGVEMGEYPGQLEDRRYMVQLSFDLGFEMGSIFGSGSSNGSAGSSGSDGGPNHATRRLKQRR